MIIGIGMLMEMKILILVMMKMKKGDKIDEYIKKNVEMKKEEMDELREKIGIERKMKVKYIDWIGKEVKGNIGN